VSQSHDVVIVGGGLAGLTAGLYAARFGLRTLVIEELMAGGQVMNVEHIRTFPGFPDGIGGMQLGPVVQAQAEAAGAEFTMATATELDVEDDGFFVVCGDDEFEGRAVIVASGSTKRRLGIRGEREFTGRGVSQCAGCDGHFFTGKRVVVVGGGDSALEEANALTEMGVAEVLLVHRGTDFSRAQQVLVDPVKGNPKITVVFDTTVEEISGDATVGGVVLRHGGETRTEQVDGVFVFAGLEPNTGWLSGAVELDEGGHVIVDQRLMSSTAGILAAGDVRQFSAAQLVASAGDGATAAVEAARHLAGTR
jgi:thioredoxin reductase (NADPH)